MIHPEQERVRKLLTEAVTLLCRNSLQFEEEVVVEGLIGITLDRSDILLISIRESVQQTLREVTSSIRSDKEPIAPASPGKRKRRKRSQESDSDAPPPATPPVKKHAPSVTDDDDDSRPDPEQRLNVNVKQEAPEDDQDHNNQNSNQTRKNDLDGRTIHPAHDSSSRNSQMQRNSDHSSAQIKQEPSGSNHSRDNMAQPAPHEQTLPPGGVRVKEEADEEPEECFVIDSDDEDMSNSSASNSMSLNMLENQLQMASQNWPEVGDESGFDINNLMQQGQNWSGQFNMQGQQMQGGNQGNMPFMGSPQPGTSQDPQRMLGLGHGCCVCGQRYVTAASLRQHLDVNHRGVYSYSCHLCGQDFPLHSACVMHLKQKHDLPAYRCYVCAQPFDTQDAQKQHLVSCAVCPPGGKLTCAWCSSTFNTLWHLKTHVDSMHLGTVVHKCQGCGKTFTWKRSFQRHAAMCNAVQHKPSNIDCPPPMSSQGWPQPFGQTP